MCKLITFHLGKNCLLIIVNIIKLPLSDKKIKSNFYHIAIA